MKLKNIYRIGLPSLALLSALNVAIAAYVFVCLRKPVSYNVQVIEPPRVDLAPPPATTNDYRAGLLPERDQPTPLVPFRANSPERWTMPYHFCVVAGRRVAILNGVRVYEGDQHAFGVVREIYPERIYFEGGNYIDNVQNWRYQNDNRPDSTLP